MGVARQDTKADSLYGHIIEGLIRRRKEIGMTQWELARKLGLDQSQISKFERREGRLDVADYARTCRAIGLDPAKLLREDEAGGAGRGRRASRH
jgi:transcriptional regulator with XRE-family HTH domain